MNGLALYLLGSVAGVAMMVGLNVLLFGRGAGVLDLEAVSRSLALDHPGFVPGHAALAVDGRAALIEDRGGHALYLARASGARFVTRKIARGSLRGLGRDGARLDLRFSDFTFPRAELAFAGEAEAGDWEARLRRAGG
jgi:hypothetical protein